MVLPKYIVATGNSWSISFFCERVLRTPISSSNKIRKKLLIDDKYTDPLSTSKFPLEEYINS